MFCDPLTRQLLLAYPLPGGTATSYDHIRESWNTSRVAEGLSLGEFVRLPDGSGRIDADRLVALISEAQREPSAFGACIFNAAARLLLETQVTESYLDNNEFSHTAKYLFMGVCFKPALRTLLDTPDAVPLATSLVNMCCEFCERSHSLGTTPLIVRAVMASNIEHWVAGGALTEFFFKPSGLMSPGFQDLLRAQTAHEETEHSTNNSTRMVAPFRLNQAFCEATAPAQFLLWVFENKVPLPRSQALPELRSLLADHLGEESARYPFLHSNNSPRESGEVQAARREVAPGVYFDVFGTLVYHDGTPNTRLVQRMMDLWRSEANRPVFLVSDSQPQEVRRALSFLSELPPLLSKEALQGKELECLIDNASPEGQGFQASRHLSPDEALRGPL